MAKAKAKAAGSQKAGLERQADLTKFTADNPWLAIFYAKHTFEVDFVAAGNHEAVVQTIPTVYKDEETRKVAKQQLQSGDLSQMGNRTLTMAKQEGKGWFALMLAEYLTPQVQIPAYIMQAIHFAHGNFLSFLSEFSSIALNTDTVPMY
jgi:putative ATP-dependent endonuclease of OLD family